MPETTLVIHGEPVRFFVERDGEEWVVQWTARGRRVVRRLSLRVLEAGVALVETAGRSHLVHTAAEGGQKALHVDGYTLDYEVAREPVRQGQSGADRYEIRSPMPGLVTEVTVREGEEVRAGQPLVILEAMKTEHVLRAAAPGVVRSLRVRPGEQVDGGAVVAEVAPR